MNETYLTNVGHLSDKELNAFATKNFKTIEELMEDMASNGWTQGMNNQGEHEY